MPEKITIFEGLSDALLFEGIKMDEGYLEGKYYGYAIHPNVRYEGRLKESLIFDGFGKLYDEYGKPDYEGYWKDGKYHGHGKKFSKINGSIEYEGMYHYNVPIDYYDAYISVNSELIKATLLADGYYELFRLNRSNLYKGYFLNNRYHGQGIAYYPNGKVQYAGQWEQGMYHGFGIHYYESGNKRYEGCWQLGVENGLCRNYFESGVLHFIGEFLNGRPNNLGVMFYDTGEILYTGVFEEDWSLSQGREYYKNGFIKFEGAFFQGYRHFYGKRYYVNGRLYTETGELRFEGDMLKQFPVSGCVGRTQHLD